MTGVCVLDLILCLCISLGVLSYVRQSAHAQCLTSCAGVSCVSSTCIFLLCVLLCSVHDYATILVE